MDILSIGSLVSEKWMEITNYGQSPSLRTMYNLVWRFDLNAQDEGVWHNGPDDTSNVYELVRPNFDRSGAAIVMDIEHSKIHCGYHFFQSGVFTLAALATMNIVVQTQEVRPHMIFSISSTEAGFTLTTREGIAANADGTLLPVFNNNRTHSNGHETTIRLNPTGINTAGSVIIREARSGSGGGTAQRDTGNLSRGNEVIMKPNTKYLLTITNLGNATNYINISHEWYEMNLT